VAAPLLLRYSNHFKFYSIIHALFKIQGDRRVDTLHISYSPEMHLIEILRWPFVVIETSIKVHRFEN